MNHGRSGPNGPAKRLFDMVVAGVASVVLAVPAGIIGCWLRFTQGSPVIFRQTRPGLGGAPFPIYKFRTMREAVDGHGVPLPDEERLTRVGRWLRRTSLDELPELVNVLRGDMSLVGPRPLLTSYLDRYSPIQARRHDVRPGITGWAQINGRNALSWEEKFDLDLWYVDHWSFALDLRILWRTLAQVVSGTGVSAPGHPTMPEFMGSGGDGAA